MMSDAAETLSPAASEEVATASQFLPLYQIGEDGGVRLNLHEGQMRSWNSAKRFIFVLAGTQSGKTAYAPWWLAREIETLGPGDYLAVTASYDLLALKMLPELIKVFVDTLGIGKYWPGNKVIEIRDPSTGKYWATNADDPMYARIILRSASAGRGDVGVRGLQSATARAAWLDECGLDDFTISAWTSVLQRLSLSEGRVLGTTTLYNHDWLYTEIYEPFLKGSPDIDIIQFESVMNPAFPLEEFERARKSMPEWKFNMVYRGVFDRPAGQIYGDFAERHITDLTQVPAQWPVIVGVDPGAVNTASVWMAQSNDGKWTVFHESLDGDLTTAQHVSNAKSIANKFDSVKFYGGAASEKQFRMDWTNAGITVMQPPVSDVEAGIDRVITLIKSDKLRVCRSCARLLRELREYSRELDSRGQPTDKIRNKEQFHCLDSLRYAVSGIRNADSGSRFTVIASTRKW